MPTVDGLFSPDGNTLGDRIDRELSSSTWNSLKVGVAFIKRSGISRLYDALDQFGAAHPGGMSFSIGIDHGGTSIEAADALYTLLTKHRGKLWFVHNPQGSPRPTYHPKMWLFSRGKKRLLIVGSGNITQGGLFTNYEASLAVTAQSHATVIRDTERFFKQMTNARQPDVVRANRKILQQLHDEGHLPSEPELRRITATSNSMRRSDTRQKQQEPLFRGRNLRESTPRSVASMPAPSTKIRETSSVAPHRRRQTRTPTTSTTPRTPRQSSTTTPRHRYFFITIRMQQKTEVFLAKRPLDEDPAFFNWPFRGLTTPKAKKAHPQPQADPPPVVRITLHTDPEIVKDNHPLKMWTYTHGPSANGDFRTNFTSEIQREIPAESVVRFERDPVNAGHLQFTINIVPPGHKQYRAMLNKCTVPLANSSRYYGWSNTSPRL